MQKFLLLRNNRQTGPYSADDLRQMGLKAYDLIWVDGKSAAWRYPGEIDDLKSFAPPVEEQPYDRFYKRPADQNTKAAEVKTETKVEVPVRDVEPPAKNPEPKKDRSYKRIFVTMPSNGQNGTISEPPKREEQPKPVAEQPKTIEQPKVIAQPLPAEEKPVIRKVIVDTSLEDPRHDGIYFPKKKKQDTKRTFLLAGAGVLVLILIGVGIFIGMSLQQPANKDTGKQETEKVYRIPDDKNISTSNANSLPQQVLANIGTSKDSTVAVKPNQRAGNVAKNNDPATQLSDIKSEVKLAPIDSVLKPKEEDKKPVEKPMPNLAKFVDVSNNDFQVGPFGGISKLKLTVSNKSDYDINLVVVDVDYLKVNKEIFKTETLYFRDIDANSSITLNAPKTGRGNKIAYRVKLISSKGHLFHAE